MRTLGPIGHLSADVRRYIEIEEDEAILGVVKIKRRPRKDDKEERQPAGGRFFCWLPTLRFRGPSQNVPCPLPVMSAFICRVTL